MRLVGVGVPEDLALVFAEASTSPAGERTGDAAACVLEPSGARQAVRHLEEQLAGSVQPLGRVFTLLGVAALLFGAEEGSRIVLHYMPAAVKALQEMADEPEDAPREDSLLASAARAEPLMLKAALEQAASSDPHYDHQLYMDESILLPGFIVADRDGAEPVELSGALVTTPREMIFVLSDAVLSEATARLIPEGLLAHGTLSFRLEELTAVTFYLPGDFADVEEASRVEFGPSPDDDVHAHFELEGHRQLSVRLLYARWPAGRQEGLRRRLAAVVERVGDALAA